MGLGPIPAVRKALARAKWNIEDIDLFEIHEAFAATVLKVRADLGIPIEKLNVNGGVIAMGHPLGATGSIMMGMLLDEMDRRDLTLGLVATSGAAGSGTAILVERL